LAQPEGLGGEIHNRGTVDMRPSGQVSQPQLGTNGEESPARQSKVLLSLLFLVPRG
jgi:hypothetical protein